MSHFLFALVSLVTIFSNISFNSAFAQANDPSELKNCIKLASREHARLVQCENLKIATVEGTPVERAQFLGEMMSHGFLGREVLQYFIDGTNNALQQIPGGMGWIMRRFHSFMTFRMFSKSPPAMVEEMKTFSQAAGIQWGEFQKALVAPDFASWADSFQLAQKQKNLATFGCTTAAARNPDGSFVIGRNLDYDGVGIWDRTPVMTVSLPPQGSKDLKTISFGSSGIHFGSISGMNEAGIAVFVHQAYAKVGFQFGMPLYFIGESVLRKSRNLHEALEVLKSYRPFPVWFFVVADLNSGEVVSLENSQKVHFMRSMSGELFAQANHMFSLNKESIEVISTATRKNSHMRFDTVMNGLLSTSHSGRKEIAHILSTQNSQDGSFSAHTDIVKPGTIQTVLLERVGGETQISMAIDSAPTPSGRYLTTNLSKLLNSLKSEISYSVEDLAQTSAEKRLRQVQTSRMITLAKAKPQEALEIVEAHSGMNATLLKAFLNLKVGNYDESLRLTQLGRLEAPQSHNELLFQSLGYLQAVSLVKLGQTAEAQRLAQKLLSDAELNIEMKPVLLNLIAKPNEVSIEALQFNYSSGDVTY